MLVLAAWRGLPLLDEMRVEGEPYGFSIPEVALAIQRWISSGCAERDEANKCVRYLCAPGPAGRRAEQARDQGSEVPGAHR
jgi:hypothetical protein